MRVLVTGHLGYLGAPMVAALKARGHKVVGLDHGLFADCTLGPAPDALVDLEPLTLDVRDVERRHLEGVDAVCHLAGLSNDPLGEICRDATLAINHRAAARLARLARDAGASRFVQASTCSVYGAAGDDWVDETSPRRPVTAYAEAKALAEDDILPLAAPGFAPTALRLATVFGFTPRLRADLMLNNLVAWARTTGEVLIKSDGTPWRPLVHAEDVARAFVAALEAPAEAVSGQAINVGADALNHQVRDVAAAVQACVPGSAIRYAEGGGPDARCYRVRCQKLLHVLPDAAPQWSIADGARQVADAYARYGFDRAALDGDRYFRSVRARRLLAEGALTADLRRCAPAGAATSPRGSSRNAGSPAAPRTG